MSKSLPKFGKFSDITSLNKLSVPFTLYSSEIPVIRISFLLAVLYRLCRLSLPSLFFYFFSSDWVISKFLSSISLILFSLCFTLLVMFSIDFFTSFIEVFSSRISVDSFFI